MHSMRWDFIFRNRGPYEPADCTREVRNSAAVQTLRCRCRLELPFRVWLKNRATRVTKHLICQCIIVLYSQAVLWVILSLLQQRVSQDYLSLCKVRANCRKQEITNLANCHEESFPGKFGTEQTMKGPRTHWQFLVNGTYRRLCE